MSKQRSLALSAELQGWIANVRFTQSEEKKRRKRWIRIKYLNGRPHAVEAGCDLGADHQEILDDGMTYHTASACIPASYVKQAAEYVQGRLPICTVIGFSNGYSTTAAKVFEAADAVKNGADEVDMVINIGWVKDGKDAELEDEIRQIHAACNGHILKVIIETCLLDGRGEDPYVRNRDKGRGGIYQDPDRLLHCRSNL